ncbi:MAG TPA: Gfo/Idh/MocA family oxidoreductase [Phycisphaerae bacterium]|nr:Gfo/Idh/MocA family oxidoreductase [Phycisphaerae bacterium]HRY67427.1 Gfo/Idh/MocA family oxidoreductase [Phycisphaerae bacterium]HSA28982.1 Gfo/Idh/MocA family oxidoreductase [Phycisphaerae bacterium]
MVLSTANTRRQFLKQSAISAAGLWLAGRTGTAQSFPANEKLGIAIIGVSGQGAYSVGNLADQAIVALCDVDENRAAETRKRFPKARFYTDFRKMFDASSKDFEAVVVATPDHTHAPATMMALKADKHVYCEKPLTHTVYEARMIAETARKRKRVTQMGTQIHAGDNYRRVVELIQKNTIGPVTEVHVWCPSVWAGSDRPKDTPPVPVGLHWDEWLGPAPVRPYHPAYAPAGWRGYWDFGGGGLADMACHYMDLPTWALELRHPQVVEAEGPPVNDEHAPDQIVVRWEHPARKDKPAVKLTWYGGVDKPAPDIVARIPRWGVGVLFIGEKGMLIADYDRHQLLPEREWTGFKPPEPFIPNSIGHHKEWVEACKKGGPTTCNFDYSGALTEAVLLGNVAYRSGKRIEWDAEKMRIANAPEAEQFLRRRYREGWTL